MILSNQNVLEVVVTNQQSEERNADIVAYLVAKDLAVAETMVKEIRKHFFQCKMHSLCPKTFYFIEKMPHGLTGKIKRSGVSNEKILYKVR